MKFKVKIKKENRVKRAMGKVSKTAARPFKKIKKGIRNLCS